MSEEISLECLGDTQKDNMEEMSSQNPLSGIDECDLVDSSRDDFGAAMNPDVQKAINECAGDVCEVVQHWLTNSPKCVNDKNSEEKTALHLAAEQCNPQLAGILLQAGADPSLVDDEERTVLHCLCALPNDENIDEFADLICSEISDIDAPDLKGCTALYYAAENGHLNVVVKLLDKGADMSVGDDIEETPVHRAAKSGYDTVLAEMIKKNPECVRFADMEENTPLHGAAGDGQLEAVKVILGSPSSPDVNARTMFGDTPLHKVACQGSTDVAKLLLEHGAELDVVSTSLERTPFHNAAYYGRTDLALFLLNKGARVSCKAFQDVVKEGYEIIARPIIECNQWPIALRGTYIDQQGKTTTPFRELTKKMPAVAELVLNHCVVEDPGLNRQDDNYSVVYNYEFLEDCHEDTDSETQSESFATSGRKKDSSTHGCSYSEVSNRESHFIPTWGPSKSSNAQHPLRIMIEKKELNLLKHPVVASLLHYKWKKFGLISYISNLLTYIVFLIFLTAFALRVPNPQTPACARNNNSGSAQHCPDQLPGFLIFSSIIVIILGGSRLAFEVVQLIFQKLSYLADWVNWVEITQYVCAIIFVFVYANNCFCVLHWQWQVGVIAVFLGWINLILFVSKLPFVGIYVTILIRICMTFANLLILALLLIVAFGLTSYMIFFDTDVLRSPFADVPRSFLKIMTMTTGELDYDAIFRLDPAGENDDLSELKYPPISYIFWITFLVVMPVIFTNMLTSLAVGDTAVVQEQAQLEKLAQQVDQVLAMENILNIFQRCVPKRWRRTKSQLEIYPNSAKKSRLQELSFRIWEGERYDHRDVIMSIVNPPEAETEEILKKTDALSDKVQNMNQKLNHFQLLLEEIAKRNGIDVQSSSIASACP